MPFVFAARPFALYVANSVPPLAAAAPLTVARARTPIMIGESTGAVLKSTWLVAVPSCAFEVKFSAPPAAVNASVPKFICVVPPLLVMLIVS